MGGRVPHAEYTPSPELVASLTAAAEARNGRRKGADIVFTCPSGEHKDRNPSARLNVSKATWYCDVCGNGGGALDLAQRLGVELSPLGGVMANSRQPRPDGRPPRRLLGTVRHELRDEAGSLVAVHVRKDYDDGSKDLPWERPDGSNGLGGLPIDTLPLYGVHELGDAAAVVLVEGEKARDALARLGVPAVGTVTGAKSCPNHDSLRPLVGRDVILWPDADDEGQGHIQRIAERLLALGQAPERLRRIAWHDAPPKGDAADFVAAGGTAEAARALIAEAPGWESVPEGAVTPGGVPGPRLIVTAMDTVQPRPVAWRWERWLAVGKLHILGGHPGDGKSTQLAALAAIFSVAGTLPDGSPAALTRSLFLLAEDALDDTFRPRLDAHGADPAHVLAIEAVREAGKGDRLFNLADHLALLEEQIVAHRIGLVVVDPLTSFMPRTDRNAEGDVRDALTPLGKIAERTGAAVVAVLHVGKPNGTGRRPLQQLLGATAFGAIARIVWMVAPCPDDETGARRVLGVVKSNLAVKPPALEWSRAEDGPIVWHGVSKHNLDDLLGGASSRPRDDAEGFLREALKGGSRPSHEIYNLGKAAGLSEITLRRAADGLAVRRSKERVAGGRWLWSLPVGTPAAPHDPDGGSARPETEPNLITPELDHVIKFDSSPEQANLITRSTGDQVRAEGHQARQSRPEPNLITPATGDHLPGPAGRIELDHPSTFSGDQVRFGSDDSARDRRSCVECGAPMPADVVGMYCVDHGGGADGSAPPPDPTILRWAREIAVLDAAEMAAYRRELANPPDHAPTSADEWAALALAERMRGATL